LRTQGKGGGMWPREKGGGMGPREGGGRENCLFLAH